MTANGDGDRRLCVWPLALELAGVKKGRGGTFEREREIEGERELGLLKGAESERERERRERHEMRKKLTSFFFIYIRTLHIQKYLLLCFIEGHLSIIHVDGG